MEPSKGSGLRAIVVIIYCCSYIYDFRQLGVSAGLSLKQKKYASFLNLRRKRYLEDTIVNNRFSFLFKISFLVLIFSLLGFLGDQYWFFDLFAHFRVHYSLILIFLLITVVMFKSLNRKILVTIYKWFSYKYIFHLSILLAS